MRELSKLSKQTFVYGLGKASQALGSLLILPFLTAYLEVKEFGVIALLALFTVIVRSIFGLGISSVLGIVYFEQSNAKEKDQVILNAFYLSLICAIFLIAIAVFWVIFDIIYINGESKYSFLFCFHLIYIAVSLMTDPLMLRIQFHDEAIKYVTITVVSIVMGYILTIFFLVYFDFGIFSWSIGILSTALSILIFGLITTYPRTKFVFDYSIIQDFLRLGTPMIPGTVFVVVILSTAPYFINQFANLSQTGIFGVGYQIGMGMTIATSALASAWYPFFQSYKKRRLEATAIFPKLTTFYVMSFGFLTLNFFLFSDLVISNFVDQKYFEAANIVGLVASAYFLYGLWIMLLPAVYFSTETFWIPILQCVAAILTIVSHMFLIPVNGAVGAAFAINIGCFSLVAMQLVLNNVRHYQIKLVELSKMTILLFILVLSVSLNIYLKAHQFDILAIFIPVTIYLVACYLALTDIDKFRLKSTITSLGSQNI